MYTTPVQSGQYKLNSVLSLAGMKVRDCCGFIPLCLKCLLVFLGFLKILFLVY